MEIVGGRKFVEIAGSDMHELPPLLVRSTPRRVEKIVGIAADIVERDDMIADLVADTPKKSIDAQLIDHERRRMDLALNLADQYMAFVSQWNWGDSIVEWIRQCETTFEMRQSLRPLLRPDVWPHAGRSSFVTLLSDKAVRPETVDLSRAVGMRLTFRQPPPIECFSNQFLFYLNNSVAHSAFDTWAALSPDPVSSLPPERFTFQIVEM